MSLLKQIISGAADLLPFGGIAKSIASGAGKLLLGKAAEKIGLEKGTVDELLGKAAELSQTDQELIEAIKAEESARREWELEFFGRAENLDPKVQLWRGVTRPAISWSIIGLMLTGVLIQWGQQLFGSSPPIVIPEFIVELAKYILGFWFGGRTIEKVVGIVKGK